MDEGSFKATSVLYWGPEWAEWREVTFLKWNRGSETGLP